MVSRAWLALVVITTVSSPLTLMGCNPACRSNEVELEVHGGKGGYVCVPRDNDSTPTTSASPVVDAGHAPDSSTPLKGSCDVVQTNGPNVPVVIKSGLPAIVPDTTLPDGQYDLKQLSYYPGNAATYAPASTVRARLVVQGAELQIGLVPDGGGPLANESVTTTLSVNVLTKVCETTVGLTSDWLVPGTAGATEEAHASYDPGTKTLRIVLLNSHGQLELYFN